MSWTEYILGAKKPVPLTEKEKETKLAQMNAFVRGAIYPSATETKDAVLLYSLRMFRVQMKRIPLDKLGARYGAVSLILAQIASHLPRNQDTIKRGQALLEKIWNVDEIQKEDLLEVLAPEALTYYNTNKETVFKFALGQYLVERTTSRPTSLRSAELTAKRSTLPATGMFDLRIYRYLNEAAEANFKTELDTREKEGRLFFQTKENVGLFIFDQILLLISRNRQGSDPNQKGFYASVETPRAHLFAPTFARALRLLYNHYADAEWDERVKKALLQRKNLFATGQSNLQKDLGISDKNVRRAEKRVLALFTGDRVMTLRTMFYMDPNLVLASGLDDPLTTRTFEKTYVSSSGKFPISKGWILSRINPAEKTLYLMQPHSKHIYYIPPEQSTGAFQYIIVTPDHYYFPDDAFKNMSRYFEPIDIERIRHTRGSPVFTTSIKFLWEFAFFIDLLTIGIEDFEVFDAFRNIDGFEYIINNLYF